MAEFVLSAFADEAGGGLLDQIRALKENGWTHIEPRGLDAGKTYEVTFDNAQTTATVSGFALVNEGVRVRLPASLTSDLIIYRAV